VKRQTKEIIEYEGFKESLKTFICRCKKKHEKKIATMEADMESTET
jgi:hypothetical protein